MSHHHSHISFLQFRRGRCLLASLLLMLVVLAFSTTAVAFKEDSTSTDPSLTDATSCNVCHGREASVASPTVAPRPDGSGTAKGPHGGYTVGTSKCETCHSVHGAPGFTEDLLPAATIAGTCETCHDGTGGGGVYGVIERRSGVPAASGHPIGVLNASNEVTVPGGDPTGADLSRTFSGESGGLTCTDCHSVHDAKAVQPFIGDRVRSKDATSSTIATNRLLRQDPGGTTSTTPVYGSEWCEGCHQGSGTGHSVATMSTTITANYGSVQRLAAYNTSSVAGTNGPLGGSNLGYVIPPSNSDRPHPICQQCHEDSRSIDNGVANSFEVSSTTESFTPSLDGAVPGNPTYQNFPHETVNDYMLIETGDSLCLNCHTAGTSGTAH